MGRRFRLDIADGDTCPVTPGHGHMQTLKGTSRQWCPHHDHDMDSTPSRWPFLPAADFRTAVEVYGSREAAPA
jgi:hypothetical protein